MGGFDDRFREDEHDEFYDGEEVHSNFTTAGYDWLTVWLNGIYKLLLMLISKLR